MWMYFVPTRRSAARLPPPLNYGDRRERVFSPRTLAQIMREACTPVVESHPLVKTRTIPFYACAYASRAREIVPLALAVSDNCARERNTREREDSLQAYSLAGFLHSFNHAGKFSLPSFVPFTSGSFLRERGLSGRNSRLAERSLHPNSFKTDKIKNRFMDARFVPDSCL